MELERLKDALLECFVSACFNRDEHEGFEALYEILLPIVLSEEWDVSYLTDEEMH